MQTPLFGPGGPVSAAYNPATHNATPPALRVGLPAGVTATERRAWNSAALTLTRTLYSEKRYPDAFEKQILARYSGQGAVGASLGEYYTPPELAETLWKMLAKLGLSGGVVLDPACGTGVLLQHAPPEVSAQGVERSEKSGRIARLIWKGRFEVSVNSFERFSLMNTRRFDALIMNPPFGARGAEALLRCPEERDNAAYFLREALLHLRAGAISAIILPYGLARQERYRALRAALQERVRVLGIYGLPTASFERTGAEFASCDVWILQSLDPDLSVMLRRGGREALEPLGLWDARFVDGCYFAQHPEHLLCVESERQGIAGRWMYYREGALGPRELRDLLEKCPTAPAPPPDVEDLRARLRNTALLGAMESALLTGGECGDTRVLGGVTEVLTSKGWQVALESDLEALSKWRALETLLEQHATLLHYARYGEANRLRHNLLLLSQETLERYGNPNSGVLGSLGNLLGRTLTAVKCDGSFSETLRCDAQPPTPRYERTNLREVLEALERAALPITLGRVREWGDVNLGDDDLLTATAQLGYALTRAGFVKSEHYFVGHADVLLAELDALEATLTLKPAPVRNPLEDLECENSLAAGALEFGVLA